MATRIFIVPEVLSEQIYAKIDAQIALHPDSAGDREAHYEWLLDFFNEHGFVPDFTLQLKTDTTKAEHCSCGDKEHPCCEHPDRLAP